MKRRKFFGTLGAGLAGLALLKPTLSESNEIQEVPPIQIEDSSSKSKGTGFDECRLYHKGVLLTHIQTIALPPVSVDVFDIHSFETGYHEYRPFVKHMNNYIELFGCEHSDNLRELFENDEVCTLIIDENELQFILNVVIMEISINMDLYCNLKVSPIGEVVRL